MIEKHVHPSNLVVRGVSVKEAVAEREAIVRRHYGPGTHPGTGTEQTVHAGSSPSGKKQHVKFDTVGFIMDFEEGNVTADQAVEGIAALMRGGVLQSLQGSYHRIANRLIEDGFIDDQGNVLELPSDRGMEKAYPSEGPSRREELYGKEGKDYSTHDITDLANVIWQDWQAQAGGKGIAYNAVPYLNAMHALQDINDTYGADSGRSIVAYFLSNASGWKGPVAREVKAELKRRLGRK